jgi:hypothetical protein
MGYDCNDLTRFVRHDCFGRFDERAARVGHVVDEDGDFVLDVADEDHAGDFVGARALFVDEGEAEVKAVGYGCCSVLYQLFAFLEYPIPYMWQLRRENIKREK